MLQEAASCRLSTLLELNRVKISHTRRLDLNIGNFGTHSSCTMLEILLCVYVGEVMKPILVWILASIWVLLQGNNPLPFCLASFIILVF